MTATPPPSGTARAAVFTELGGPEVLRIVDKPIADPGVGEVQVRIHRSGVNPTDWKTRSGATATPDLSIPNVPNQDGAGVVEAVGAGVDPELIGQRVWVWEAAFGRPEGTAQELALVPAGHVVPLPTGASFDLGAALGVPFVTAHRCLTVAEGGPQRLGPGTLDGRTVLVAGGAGAVGNAAIQLARWSGATVITTVSSPAKAQLATVAGAEHVIDYRQQDVVAEIGRIAPDGVDVVVEVAPAANAAIDAAVIAQGGTVAMYANDGGDEATLPVRASMVRNARWQFVLLYSVPATAKAVAREDITTALVARAIAVGEDVGLPLTHFPLERTADAHRAVQDGTVGKVLIDVTD